jgi:uncharacterized protein
MVQSGEKITSSKIDEVAAKYSIGVQTVKDIVEELQKPNRDPRDGYPAPIMQKGVLQFEDLREGMKVTGKIRNVVDFGAFVDIGLHETGLVHLSELSDSFVSDPMEVVKVGDVREFTIIQLDTIRRRISLSLKSDAASRAGTGEKSAPRRENRGGDGGKGGSSSGNGKRVVIVKKGDGTRNGAGENRNSDYNRSRDGNRDSQNRRQSSGSDDGMSYNPFAAFFNK